MLQSKGGNISPQSMPKVLWSEKGGDSNSEFEIGRHLNTCRKGKPERVPERGMIMRAPGIKKGGNNGERNSSLKCVKIWFSFFPHNLKPGERREGESEERGTVG